MSLLENRVIVDTPESIAFNYNVAGIGSRFIAVLLDTLIQITIYVSLFIAASFVPGASDAFDEPNSTGFNWLVAIIVFVSFLLFVLYFALFESVTNGQTPGKRIMHLRVVKENGHPLQIIDAVIRNLVRLVDFFPGVYAIGSLSMLLNDRAKRLGDFAAGTIVIKEGSALKLEDIAGSPTPAMPAPGLETLFEQAARHVTEGEAAAIESLLRRWHRITNSYTVAEQLATALKVKIEFDPQERLKLDAMEPRAFLEQLAAAYRRRSSGV